jgi:hypothetical protein
VIEIADLKKLNEYTLLDGQKKFTTRTEVWKVERASSILNSNSQLERLSMQ